MKQYSTVSGDTWDKIAFTELGDENLAGVIIEANIEHVETVLFKADVQLFIPEVPETLSENLPPWKRSER